MSGLSIADKTFLEAVLSMNGGYVLDFTEGSFANLLADVNIDIYDNEKYSGFGSSKANRLRALWKNGSDAEASAALSALADYVEAKKSVGGLLEDITEEQIAKIRRIARELGRTSPTPAVGAPVAITTEATVTNNRISIEIHEDIYSHIGQYLAIGDYFHAIDESYKIVREKLRELTGKEKASDVFSNSAQSDAHYQALFGKPKAANAAQADFFRGVGYLHLGVQHLRNEKAHTLATSLEPNLAVHYIALASLAYDLITRYVSDESIKELEELVHAKRRSYRTASAFYRDFENGRWIESFELPSIFALASVRKALKDKWLREADFTLNWDHSNVVLMRLELVADELTQADVDELLDLPTHDSYGHNQLAGMKQFLEYVGQKDLQKLSTKARAWLAE
ncbi:TIGR02391 family protein [Micromonospora luteifusca]|uniref:TIGR02391 family protein n=1 Tax=Micromonospora luteifusca TaxID=709860 RepID=UPI0033B6D916